MYLENVIGLFIIYLKHAILYSVNILNKIKIKKYLSLLLVLVVFYLGGGSVFAAPGDLLFYDSFGSSGSGMGQFSQPNDILVHSNGKVYIADSNNGRVQIFNLDGDYETQFTTTGVGAFGLAEHPVNGNIYLTNHSPTNGKIQIYSETGTLINEFGSSGSGIGQFNWPTGLAFSQTPSVKLFVADSANNRIQVFDDDGTPLSQFGTQGSGLAQFENPFDVSVSDDGRVFVSDGYNSRVQIYNSDTYAYIDSFGSNGIGDGQFENPVGIEFSDGLVYVADWGNERVQVFDGSAPYNYIRQIGTTGSGPGMFNKAFGLDVGDGRLYVSDHINSYVQIFSIEQAVAPPNNTTTPDPGQTGQASNANSEESKTSASSPELAKTGAYSGLAVLIGSVMLAVALYTFYDYRKHRAPLIKIDPSAAQDYTYLHHLKYVSLPLFSYRFSLTIGRVVPSKSTSIRRY
jgi:sugar lactone lactonase YvrE